MGEYHDLYLRTDVLPLYCLKLLLPRTNALGFCLVLTGNLWLVGASILYGFDNIMTQSLEIPKLLMWRASS